MRKRDIQKKVAIDLTWVRPGKVGGTESCVRNLLDGMMQCPQDDFRIYLLVAKDNLESFAKYQSINHFIVYECDTISERQKNRVLWQNFGLGKLLRKLEITLCLEPIYGKPFLGTRKIDFITTIHDLQAYHYPEYFSKLRVLWMKLSWWNAIQTSKYVIAISNYVKEDIISKYNVPSEKIKVIYDAIILDPNDCNNSEGLRKYKIEKNKYYYTVSSLLPHKNLKTLLHAMALLKRKCSEKFFPLVVSGVGGKSKEELDGYIRENNLEGDVIFTSFVDNAERNMLYKNCKVFLFPSIFEGFGMPPVEAMIMGVPVVTTRRTSLMEVTDGRVNYVENPCDEMEWVRILQGKLKISSHEECEKLLYRYDSKTIAKEYYNYILEVDKKED